MSSTLLRHSRASVESSQSESMTANYRPKLETSREEVKSESTQISYWRIFLVARVFMHRINNR